ncbi:MAG: hypothetical protein ACE10K_08665 [Rhodothermales bacterium]
MANDAGPSGIVDREPGRPNPPDPAALMAEALSWVEQNQTLAMLGAFALGVFIGASMRD